MFKKVNRLFFLLVFLLVTNLFFCGNVLALDLSEEPMNLAFQEYFNNPTVESEKIGTIPSPLKITGTMGIFEESSSFDLRTLNRVTPVKDQIVYGPDWAFAGLGSLESNLLSSGTEADFSERHLMNNSLYNLNFSQGGNRNMATAYLTRYHGPVFENDDSSYDPPSTITMGFMPDKVKSHVQDIYYIPDKDLEAIQRSVKDYGAVVSTVYWSPTNYNSSSFSYYHNGTQEANHSILIVGWDDTYSRNNFITPPPGDGAFIVKDSWGANSHNQGFYYVSYYDSAIGTDNYVIEKTEQVDNYKEIYQYDQLGWTNSAGLGANTAWFANVFTPVNGAIEQLEAVAFYTRTPNATYELYVASDFYATGFGGMVLAKQGTISQPGYHTIKLDSSVKLKNNRRFAVAIKLTTPGSAYPIPLESPISGYSFAALSNEAESFISDSGQPTSWVDLKETSLSSANVCLKAFTNEAPPLISFSPASYTIAENGGTVTLTISRSQNTVGSLTVDFTTSNGTAIAGSDYTSTSNTITFADGETSKTISIPIVDDSSFEPAENFNVTLNNPSKGTITTPTAAVQITDNDADIAFNPSSYTVNENTGFVTLTINRTQNTNGALTVQYATASGSATAGIDFTDITNTITFNNGETTKTISIPILDDSLYDPNESFTVTLSNPTNGTITQAVATVNITDNDLAPRIAFSPTSYSVAETGASITLTINRTQNTVNSVTVNYSTSNGTATGNSDYTMTSGTITFASGEITKTLVIPILDDSLYEPNETFTVNLSNVSVGTITSATASITITENDPAPQLAFNPIDYPVGENNGSVILSVNRTLNTSGTLTVNYITSNGTAVAGGDYTSSSGIITFADGETIKTISIPILDDSIYETNESFTLTLSNPSIGTVSSATATVTITDNDTAPEVQIYPVSYVIAENSTSVSLTVYRSQNNAGALTINYETSNGTAIAGSDFTNSSGTVTFADGETTKTFSIPILDDSISETDESFTVGLTNLSNGTISSATATVTIIDNDALISFNPNTYTVAENAGSVALTVYRNYYTTGTLTVDYATSNGTALAGNDYTITNGTLTFADGETSKTIFIPIFDDSLYDPNEVFTVTLSNPSNGTVSIVTATVTIDDNDETPEVEFNPSNYIIPENVGSVVLTVNRTQNTAGILNVNYSTSSGTAIAVSDFTTSSGYITFADGETTKTISIPILDDSISEANESFTVILSNPSNGAISSTTATVTIADNDPLISFIPSTYTIAEDAGSVTLNVYREHYVAGALTVNYASSNGTALAGNDYTSTNGTLTFADEEIIKTIFIPISDDSIYETTESFIISLSNASNGTITTENATVTITDNDITPEIGFNPINYTTMENGGSVILTVYRTQNIVGSLSVNYSTFDGTAKSGNDFAAANGTITFSNGESIKTIEIPIIDDNIYENNENLSVKLLSSSIGTITNSNSTVTIGDNDTSPVLSFNPNEYLVQEDCGIVALTVSRTGNTSGTLNFSYITINGTATEGSDFIRSEETLTFLDGESTKTINIPIVDNNLNELIEYFTVKIINQTIGSSVDSEATITLQDNDSVPQISFSSSNYTVKERAASITITVQRNGNIAEATSLDYSTIDGTATGGLDYVSASGKIQFDPGQNIKSFTINIWDDSLVEGNENFSINFSNPDNATLSTTTITVTILDSEMPTIVDVSSKDIIWKGLWYTEPNGVKYSLKGGINSQDINFIGAWSYTSNTASGLSLDYWTGSPKIIDSSAGIFEGNWSPIKTIYSSGYTTYTGATNASTVINDNDTKITWVENWSTITNNNCIGGSLKSSVWAENSSNISVSYNFNTEKITWYTTTGTNRGFAEVYIDGLLIEKVDLFSPFEQFQVPKTYTVNPGSHIITIYNTGGKNPLSTGTRVDVDAFDSNNNPDSISYTFNGKYIGWQGTKSNNKGIAEIYIDGNLIETIDMYNAIAVGHSKTYQVEDGDHILTIKSTGKRNYYSSNTIIQVDKFAIPNQAASISFIGNSITWYTAIGNYGSAEVYIDGALVDTVNLNGPAQAKVPKTYNVSWGYHTFTVKNADPFKSIIVDDFYIPTLNATASLNFEGNSITCKIAHSTDSGYFANVYIDNQFITMIYLNSVAQVKSYTWNVSPGSHIIAIENIGAKNGSGTKLQIVGFEYVDK